MMRIVQAFVVYGSIYCLIFLVISVQGVPRTIGLIQPITFFILIVGLRFLAQHLLNREYKPLLRERTLPRALIYGAGSVGKKMETALKNNKHIEIIGFLDDDINLQGNTLNGLKIHNPNKLKDLVLKLRLRQF